RQAPGVQIFFHAGTASLAFEVLRVAILAGQKSGCKSEVRCDSQAIFAHDGQEIRLILFAFEKVIERLQDLVARELATITNLQSFAQARAFVVRGADEAHLTLLDQSLIGAERVLEWRVRVIPVRKVDIDVTGLKTA